MGLPPLRRSRGLVVFLCAPWLWLTTGCDRQPVTLPRSDAAGVTPPLRTTSLSVNAAGYEYEPDTGNLACPAILYSHVQYWVNINAVGPTLFTFYAPHVRMTYVGGGVYRYRMTVGKSADEQWMAEGPWTGKCIGFGQWGIGKVLSFEGTVWRVGDDDVACGGGGGGGRGGTGGELVEVVGYDYDPYDPGVSLDGGDCESGGSTGTGTQYEPGDYTGGETVDWGTGIGNGGTSACGEEAMVEYVCIDTYNEETGEWEKWGCGFVTTC
jgi:hypothetical protein